MANAMRQQEAQVIVHQALHGYEDGHRLLASSVSLKGRDPKTVLIMSDVSGSSARIDKSGYLTGYPLPESGFYALARTWAAPEMPRPGCVWTHTLLIDFNDLASLDGLVSLVNTFRRPTLPIDRNEYKLPITILHPTTTAINKAEAQAQRQLLASILFALYGKPYDKVVLSPYSTTELERCILEIWEQQWPRLRRSFRFCTLSYADRSTEGTAFDLQVLPKTERPQQSRGNIPGIYVDLHSETSQLPSIGWLDTALDDLLKYRPGHLREFLRQAGVDVSTGRSAFVPLCELNELLFKSYENKPKLLTAVQILETKIKENEASLIRKAVVQQVIEHISDLDQVPLSFVLNNIHLIEEEWIRKHALRLGQVIWKIDRSAFWNLIDEDGPKRIVAELTIIRLPAEEIITILEKSLHILKLIIQLRPTLLQEALFWQAPDIVTAKAFEIVKFEGSYIEETMSAMIKSENTELTEKAWQNIPAEDFLSAIIKYLDRSQSETLSDNEKEWVTVSVRDTNLLASYLSSKAVRTKSALLAFALATHPDAVTNSFGEDPWLIAMRSSSGKLSDYGQIYLATYLLARSLGNSSRSTAELIVLTFDDVYEATAQSKLTDKTWKLIESRLPWSIFWFGWDRCHRLRVAVTEAFVDRDLSFQAYINITANDDLFHQLTMIISRNSRGRKYLREARKALIQSSNDSVKKRIRIIDKAIRL